MSAPVLVAAGGTGGHMFPAMALCRELQRRGREVAVLTDARGARYVGPGLERHVVPAGSPAGGTLPERLLAAGALARGLAQSVAIFRQLRPAAAAAFGGYACVPAALAAALTRVPLLVHEQNAVFGRANRLVARFARVVALSFAETEAVPAPDPARRVLVSGNPVRPDFAPGGGPGVARASGSKSDGDFRLLVMGGSQGARVFSDVVPAALALLPAELRARLRLAQQCRPEDLDRVGAAYAGAGLDVELAAFFADAAERMAAADLVLTRSGASTVAELLLLGRPAILVPYPQAADDHQRANAARLEAAGAARLVPQAELTPARLAGLLAGLMAGPAELGAMAGRARGLAHPEAAALLADAVLDIATPALAPQPRGVPA